MIADRIDAYLRGEIAPTPERIAWARNILEGVGYDSFGRNFIDRFAGEAEEKRAAVSGSSKFYCPRTLAYAIQGAPKEPAAPRAYRAFYMGDNVEAMVTGLAVLAGCPVLDPKPDGEQYVCHLDLGGNRIPGHVDMTLDYNGYVAPVEIKSHADYGFDQVAKTLEVPRTFGHWTQLQFYLHAMDAPRGFYVAVKKSTGHCVEIEVERDPAALEEIQRAYALALNATETACAPMPPRPDWAKEKAIAGTMQIDSVRCSYCNYRPLCWPGYEMTVVGGKPVYRRKA